MKTPFLNSLIKDLTETKQSPDVLQELEAIKSIIENTLIVSTPENPVWVVDEYGDKRILLADLGEKVFDNRFILVFSDYERQFLKNKEFDWTMVNHVFPIHPKSNH